MGWKSYTDRDPDTFSDMEIYAGTQSEGSQLAVARNLTGLDISAEDLARYMPQYDRRAEENMRRQRQRNRTVQSGEIFRAGSGRQSELLSIAQEKYGQQAKGGFAATGNPMIDKQRQDIFTDIRESQSGTWDQYQADEFSMETDIYDHQQAFQQKWAERLIEYEDKMEKEAQKAEDDKWFWEKW
jgi:hypothetical protein